MVSRALEHQAGSTDVERRGSPGCSGRCGRTWEPSCGCTMVRGAPGVRGELTTTPKGTSSPVGTPRRRTSSTALNASWSRSARANPVTWTCEHGLLRHCFTTAFWLSQVSHTLLNPQGGQCTPCALTTREIVLREAEGQAGLPRSADVPGADLLLLLLPPGAERCMALNTDSANATFPLASAALTRLLHSSCHARGCP